MDYSSKMTKVKNELRKNVRVSIAWDGYYDPEKLEELLEADESTNCTVPYSDVFEDLGHKKYNGVGDYVDIKAKVAELEKIINTEADFIVGHADKLSQDVNKIKDNYYSHAAKKIEKKYKLERVFIAPGRWLPFSEN